MKTLSVKFLLLFLCLSHAGLASSPSKPDLFRPANRADKISFYFVSLQWSIATDDLGNEATYDLYLGKTPDPPLFREGLYNNWMSDDQMEFGSHIVFWEGTVWPHLFYLSVHLL